MAGVVLATGIVELIPSMRGSQRGITSELSGIDTKTVGKNLGKSMGTGIAGSLKTIVGGAIATLGAVRLGGLTKEAVSSFSELEDSTAAAGVVFGKSMGSIIDQSKTASRQLGLSSQQVINAANTYGTYGKAAGLGGDALAKFSTDFTVLAGDMASFKGTSTEQAIEAIGAALRGETEPIRAYGVMLDDASMRQKALELGITDTVKNALTPQQKILAAQALIFEQTTDAQGDFARTSQSTANIQKTLAADTENLSAKFGQVLAPAFTAARKRAIGVVGGLSTLLDTVIEFQEGTKFTPDLVRAVGLDPSQGLGLALNEGIGGIMAFGNAWKANDGDITSSGFPGWMEATAFKLRTAAGEIKTAGAELVGGDFSAVGPLFESILAVAKPAAPIFVELGQGIGTIAGEIGGLLASGFPLLVPILQGATNVMTFLAENSWALTAAIIGITGAYIAFKTAQALGNVAQLLAVPVTLANAAANYTLAGAIRAANASSSLQASTNKKTGATMFGVAAATGTAATTTGVYAGAATGATVASRLLGGALRALPFVGLLAAIAGLVAGVIWFFTETETGRGIVTAAWEGIKLAAAGVVDWFQGTAVPIFHSAISGIGGILDWLNTNVVQPVFAGIMTAVGWGVDAFNWLQTATAPVFSGIGTVIGGFYLFFRGVFQVVVSIIRHIVIPALQFFWTGIVVPVFQGIGKAIGDWWNAAGIVFGIAVGFIRNTLAAGFTWFRDSIITPVFDFIGGVISTAWRGWEIIFGAVAGFLKVTLGPAFTWFRDTIITPVWDFISSKISGVWNDKIKPIFDFFGDAIEVGLPKAFELGRDTIETIWDGIQDIAKAPVKFVVDVVLNKGLIAGFNWIAGILPDVDKLPDIKLPAGFAGGGRIPGWSPHSKADNIPIMATADEFMIRQESATRLEKRHPGALDYINRYGVIPGIDGYATGGFIWPVPRQYPVTQYPSGGHPAYDIGTPVGVPVSAAQSGRVALAGPGYRAPGVWGGTEVHLDHGGGAGSLYAHLSSLLVRVGQMVSQGDTIARTGNTGISSGPHLHFGALNGSNMVSPDRYLNGGSLPGGPFGAVGGGGGGNPLAGLVDTLAGKLSGLIDGVFEKFEGNAFADIAVGVGKKIWTGTVDWVKGLLGGDGDSAGPMSGGIVNPLLYDGGGWLENTGGKDLLVRHDKSKPDAVLSNPQWNDIHALAADRSAVDDHPAVIAQFTGTDFDQAEEIADALWYSIKRRRRGGVKARRRELV